MSDIALTVVPAPEITLSVEGTEDVVLAIQAEPVVQLVIGAETGPPGPTGPQGPGGGPAGPAGEGVPAGGVTGALLEKTAGGDYATAWSTLLATVITIDGGLL